MQAKGSDKDSNLLQALANMVQVVHNLMQVANFLASSHTCLCQYAIILGAVVSHVHVAVGVFPDHSHSMPCSSLVPQ